jgi:hypothetical protein
VVGVFVGLFAAVARLDSLVVGMPAVAAAVVVDGEVPVDLVVVASLEAVGRIVVPSRLLIVEDLVHEQVLRRRPAIVAVDIGRTDSGVFAVARHIAALVVVLEEAEGVPNRILTPAPSDPAATTFGLGAGMAATVVRFAVAQLTVSSRASEEEHAAGLRLVLGILGLAMGHSTSAAVMVVLAVALTLVFAAAVLASLLSPVVLRSPEALSRTHPGGLRGNRVS